MSLAYGGKRRVMGLGRDTGSLLSEPWFNLALMKDNRGLTLLLHFLCHYLLSSNEIRQEDSSMETEGFSGLHH